MKINKILLKWLIFSILAAITMEITLFAQTIPQMKNASYLMRLMVTEVWATIQWMFIIPRNKLGNLFLNPAQLGITTYIFQFITQMFSNKYWMKMKTPIDDYFGVLVMCIGMVVSKMRLFG